MATKSISALVSEGKILATPDGDEYLYIYEPDGADDANKGLAIKMDTLSSYFSTFVPLTTPLTSTSWDGDSFSTTAKTKIDLSAVFGVPAGVKAVSVKLIARDSGSATANPFFGVSPNDVSNSIPLMATPRGLPNDTLIYVNGIVPCDASGDIFYQVYASGTLTMDCWIEIWGYFL